MATIYTRGRAKYLQWSEAGQQRRISLGAVTDAEAEASRLAKERELAGFQHASVTTTEVYTQVVGEHLKAPLRDLAL